MSGIVEFIEARLTEDEERARAVEPLGSVWDMGGTELPEVFLHTRLKHAAEDGRPRTVPDPAADAHFARHDPARVLREVEAKRAILAEHQPKLCRNCAYMCDVPCCSGCGQTNPCPTLRALASVWSDHPDYDPAWGRQ